jgi:hypothetical protein
MAYKARFHPCEALAHGSWCVLAEGENLAEFAQAAAMVTENVG